MTRIFRFAGALALLAGLFSVVCAAEGPPPAREDIESGGLMQLLSIRRVYVDRFTGGETAAQMRDLIIASLEGAKLFVVTENQERADFVLRGAAEDLVYTEVHASSDGLQVRTQVGASRSTRERAYAGASGGENESNRSEDRRHEAMATVRLVNKDGDVIWSTTQESKGGKFRGASADVADKVAAKLADDFDRARKLSR
jgi:hypothetical protein